jgi:hypothetical protein
MPPPTSILDLVQRFDQNRESYTTSADQGKAVISRLIDDTDSQIDKLVYELYGLTSEEIAIVEGSSKAGNCKRTSKKKPSA